MGTFRSTGKTLDFQPWILNAESITELTLEPVNLPREHWIHITEVRIPIRCATSCFFALYVHEFRRKPSPHKCARSYLTASDVGHSHAGGDPDEEPGRLRGAVTGTGAGQRVSDMSMFPSLLTLKYMCSRRST